jgi:signal transduction histidine kinase
MGSAAPSPSLSAAYACRTLADAEPERWGEDARLVAVLGERGAAGFRALFDEYPEAVGVLWALRDETGSIVDFAFGYGNPTMLRRTRIPPSTPERYTLLKALPQMRGSRAFDAYVHVCDSGEPWVEEVTYDTPFGDGYMLGTYVLRVSKLGDGLVVFLTDVTEERRMEAELRSYADVVAHDLSEPVASIELLAGLLERRGHEPPPPDVVRQLRESARNARELIDAVLSYARAGELQMQPLSLDRLVAEVVDEMRPQLDRAAVTLRVHGPLPEVEGDATQLRRVLQNLLGNAVKFRGDDPPRVEVSAQPDSKEWVITVRDNGVGVDPERATRIFGMFARGNAGASGTGIGLAVCRRILEAHGGRIWVEPAEGGGSAFRFTLPR